MELLEQEIDSADLQIGMYVSRLDRDWNGTPFPLQGVLVRGREDIDQISRYARRVWVDLEKSTGPAALHLRPGFVRSGTGPAGTGALNKGRQS